MNNTKTYDEASVLFFAYDAIYPRDTDDGWHYITPATQPNLKVTDYMANQLAKTGKYVGNENGYITVRVEDIPLYDGLDYADCYFDFTITESGLLELSRICPIFEDDEEDEEEEED